MTGVMTTDFMPRCPHCFSGDFQPVEVRRVESPNLAGYFYDVWIERRANSLCGHSHIERPHAYDGEELYHCNTCGKVFEREAAIELRLLEGVML